MSKLPPLVWAEDLADDPIDGSRWVIQTEHVRGEGVWHHVSNRDAGKSPRWAVVIADKLRLELDIAGDKRKLIRNIEKIRRIHADEIGHTPDPTAAAVRSREAPAEAIVLRPIEAPAYVWCDHHGSIHDRDDDPHGYGSPDCGEQFWRTVYVAGTPGEEF